MLKFAFLLALAALPALSQRVVLVSGNGQMARENFPAGKPMVIQAVNAAGIGIPNAAVTWKVTQGEGALSDIVTTTDASGFASAVFRGVFLAPPNSYRTSTVNASVAAGASVIGSADFVVTTYTTRTIQGGFAPQPQVDLIAPIEDLSGSAGSVLPQAVIVRVTSLAGIDIGKGIPNVGVLILPPDDPAGPTAQCAGTNNLVLTDANGIANCDLILGPTPASGYLRANAGGDTSTRLFRVTITPGSACTFNVSPTVQNASSAGTNGAASITVASGQNCSWTASSAASWITITSGAFGQGNGSVAYTVAANTGQARTGVINIAGKTLTINQAAQGSSGGQITILSTSPLPTGIVGQPFTYQFQASGGTQPYTFSAGGTFPPGLGLTPSTGAVSGTPTTAGAFAFTIQVSDLLGASTSQQFTMTVAPGQGGGSQLAFLSTSPLPAASVNVQYSYQLLASGGRTPYQFSLTGSLPPGMALNASSGTISGIPASSGTYAFTVVVVDANGGSISAPFSLTVNPAGTLTLTTPSPLPTGVVGTHVHVPVRGNRRHTALQLLGNRNLPPRTWIDAIERIGNGHAHYGRHFLLHDSGIRCDRRVDLATLHDDRFGDWRRNRRARDHAHNPSEWSSRRSLPTGILGNRRVQFQSVRWRQRELGACFRRAACRADVRAGW